MHCSDPVGHILSDQVIQYLFTSTLVCCPVIALLTDHNRRVGYLHAKQHWHHILPTSFLYLGQMPFVVPDNRDCCDVNDLHLNKTRLGSAVVKLTRPYALFTSLTHLQVLVASRDLVIVDNPGSNHEIAPAPSLRRRCLSRRDFMQGGLRYITSDLQVLDAAFIWLGQQTVTQYGMVEV